MLRSRKMLAESLILKVVRMQSRDFLSIPLILSADSSDLLYNFLALVFQCK